MIEASLLVNHDLESWLGASDKVRQLGPDAILDLLILILTGVPTDLG